MRVNYNESKCLSTPTLQNTLSERQQLSLCDVRLSTESLSLYNFLIYKMETKEQKKNSSILQKVCGGINELEHFVDILDNSIKQSSFRILSPGPSPQKKIKLVINK